MKRKKSKLNISRMISRYLILILTALPNLWIFYFIFTPLTVYPVYFLTKLFFDASLFGNIVFIGRSVQIELIRACIAGAAYYLLFIFNMSIPNIKLKKRIMMIAFAFLSFLVLNILRIISLILIYMKSNPLFNLTHEIFWYALGTIFVVGIWFIEVKIFNIKEIPAYSDIKFLIAKIRRR